MSARDREQRALHLPFSSKMITREEKTRCARYAVSSPREVSSLRAVRAPQPEKIAQLSRVFRLIEIL